MTTQGGAEVRTLLTLGIATHHRPMPIQDNMPNAGEREASFLALDSALRANTKPLVEKPVLASDSF